ncbi:hypothetical protein C1646_766761 [Rhizophagus diaphanus]|nr:hypothetical protein C1646_766761 [Rhizophagus diaphanus] [Rhizophagus sp. MUCL 43196]
MGFIQNLIQCESVLQVNKKNRKCKSDEAFGEDFDYIYGIIITTSEWYFILFALDGISTLKEGSEEEIDLCKNVKQVMEVIVRLLKDRLEHHISQHITELEAENAELRKKNTEIHDLRIKLSVFDAEIVELKRRNAEFLRANKEYNERRDAENAKLKVRIEELESEFGDRITKVEQKQTLQSVCKASQWLTANDNSSNNSSPNFALAPSANPVAVPEAITVPTNSAKCLNGKSLKEKDMDSFLLESAKNQVHSKLTYDKKTVTNGNDQDWKLSLSTGNNISALSSIENNLPCDMKMITCTDTTEQTLKHELSRPISSVESVKLHDESILNNAIEGSMQRLAYWIDEAMRMGLKEILYLYHYSFEFEEKVKNITADGKTKDKTARSMIYKEMLQYLPNVTLDYVNDRVYVISKTVTNGNDQSHMISAETILSQAKFSSENFDYYGITDETSCPLCSLDHHDEESIEETGYEPWQLSEAHASEASLLVNSKPENKVSYLSFSGQYEEKGPITFKAKPDPELIIKSVLEHFTYLKFRNSFRGIDNYDFTSPQPWSSPCPICDGIHKNYGLHGSWYCEMGISSLMILN